MLTLSLQMLIEKDELQQEQEGVLIIILIKIHSHFFDVFFLSTIVYCLEWKNELSQVLMDIEDLACEE